MAEYIDKTELLERLKNAMQSEYPANKLMVNYAHGVVLHAPAADVVEVETLKAWLYQIAMNNVGRPIEDMASACEEIANRLDGLRAFARERKENG